MPRFAANLTMMYPEHPFPDRFAAAAADGFEAVEYMFPYAYDGQLLAQKLQDHGLQQVLINTPPGDWDAGERGTACIPGREEEFKRGVESALAYATLLNCPSVHVMAGLAPQGYAREQLQDTYQSNLSWAAGFAHSVGKDLLIEPINTRDIPHFFLNHQAEAHRIVTEIGMPNLKVQMDLYHCQIVEGDLTMKLRTYLPTGRVGHIQIAGVPERHEPDLGEINHDYLFQVLDDVSAQCGWQGWVGCEYRPIAGTSEGLGWFTPFKKTGRR